MLLIKGLTWFCTVKIETKTHQTPGKMANALNASDECLSLTHKAVTNSCSCIHTAHMRAFFKVLVVFQVKTDKKTPSARRWQLWWVWVYKRLGKLN